MSLKREQIVDALKKIVGEDQVVTDEQVLKESSVDRFRRFEAYHGVYRLPLPAAVVNVNSLKEVAAVIKFANENKINVVPRTGHSATEGGLETALENSIVVDGSGMNKIISIDTDNMQATAQCGASLQELDDRLREQGYTTGHSPQSKPLARLGGLVATRSIGQFSTLYGGIEDMVVGLEAVFPDGGITRIKNVPRRAAGPDIRHVIIGNEGALCYITEVTVKIFKYFPENNKFIAFTRFFSGLTDELSDSLTNEMENITVDKKPSNVICEDTPDIWLNPEVVMEITGDEITVSDKFATLGYSMRFPVFQRLRPEKGPLEITTVEEIKELYKTQ